jgi:hypothetical protein
VSDTTPSRARRPSLSLPAFGFAWRRSPPPPRSPRVREFPVRECDHACACACVTLGGGGGHNRPNPNPSPTPGPKPSGGCLGPSGSPCACTGLSPTGQYFLTDFDGNACAPTRLRFVPACATQRPDDQGPAHAASGLPSLRVQALGTRPRTCAGCPCGHGSSAASSPPPLDSPHTLPTRCAAAVAGTTCACGACHSQGEYFNADRQRFNCGTYLNVCKGSKCIKSYTVDYGPSCYVEDHAGGPVLDASPAICQGLFGLSSCGWSDHLQVSVATALSPEEDGIPLGPYNVTEAQMAEIIRIGWALDAAAGR